MRRQHSHIKQRTTIVATSGTIPAISHVAVTVTDLSVSEVITGARSELELEGRAIVASDEDQEPDPDPDRVVY